MRALILRANGDRTARHSSCYSLIPLRLRKPLSLPKIQPRPPCPPRAYQKLYRYLDTALPTAVKRSERAPKPKIAQTTPTKISSTRTTPARAKAKPPESLTHIKTIPRASRTRAELPEWTMPVIRRFCSALKAPTSVPHVFAGVSSILTLQPSIPSASLKEDKIPALIVAVFLFVETRLLGRDLNKDDLTREKAHALQILKSVDLFKDSREIVGIGDINDWVEEIEEKNWTSLDWFSNVGQERNLVATISSNEGSMDLDGDSRERIVPVQKAQTAEASTKTLEAGIGTMVYKSQMAQVLLLTVY